MHVDESSPLKVDRDGQTWFFCSEHCRDLFLGRTVSRPAADAPAALYYCPMCPGEESNRPGTCLNHTTPRVVQAITGGIFPSKGFRIGEEEG